MLKLQSLGFGGKASAVMEAATAVMLSSGGGAAAAHSASASSSAAVAELAAEKGANVDEGDREGRGGGDADAAAVGADAVFKPTLDDAGKAVPSAADEEA